MSYIGKEPQVGGYNMLDALTASATASYSLTLDSVAFVPESANHLICSLNGVIQKAGSSFTVSGSTLTFSSALTSSDSIDFVLALGNVLDIGTPSDSTVTNAKTNFVSTSSAAGLQIKGDNTTAGTLQLNCEQNSHGVKLRSPAHSASQSYTLTLPTTAPATDKMLQTDSSGNLSFVDAPSGGFIRTGGQSTHTNAGGYYLDNVFSNTYKNYRIVGTLMKDNTSANIYCKLRSWDGSSGGNLSSSVYCCSTMSGARNASGGTSILGSFANAWNNSYFSVTQDSYNDRNTNRYAVHIDWLFYRPDSSAYSAAPYIVGSTGYWEYNGGSDRFRTMQFSMAYMDSVSPAGISFYPSAGDMSMIDINIYGMVAS